MPGATRPGTATPVGGRSIHSAIGQGVSSALSASRSRGTHAASAANASSDIPDRRNTVTSTSAPAPFGTSGEALRPEAHSGKSSGRQMAS